MDFLQLQEQLRAEEASARRLFGTTAGDGETSIHAVQERQARNARYQARLAEAATIYANALAGSRSAMRLLTEAMSTSDFPILFGDLLDRQVLARYREWPEEWETYAARRTVRDFRTVEELKQPYGMTDRLEHVKELEEYPERDLEEQARISYAVRKYGARAAFSWETMINDDLEQLRDIPMRFAAAARRTETRFVSDLFLGVNGPNATLFSNANGNIVNLANGARSNNPVLSIDGLQDAFTVLSNQRDEEGNPIFIDMVTLVVPPALEVIANNIVNATLIRATTAGGTSGQELEVANWMSRRLRVVVNPYIPINASTANGNTSWFLFGNPSGGDRPALRIAFLRGYEEPQVFVKAPNARRVGGGEADPMDGDFDTDSIEYKVRHVLGGSIIDPKFAVASNGSAA